MGALARRAAAAHHARQGDLHRAGRHPPGRRQGRDERAGTVRAGLRHLHPAPAGGRDRRRGVPRAVPHRPRPRRHRGHLPGGVLSVLLAQRAGPEQRAVRRRHGALGHQGQARRHARLPALRRQVPRGRAALRPRLRRDFEEVEEQARRYMEQGFRYIRCQVAVPGYSTYGSTDRAPAAPSQPSRRASDAAAGAVGARTVLPDRPAAVRAHARAARRRGRAAARRPRAHAADHGDPAGARTWSRTSLFFLEDPFAPEDNDYFRILRQQTAIPIAMGELFVNQPSTCR